MHPNTVSWFYAYIYTIAQQSGSGSSKVNYTIICVAVNLHLNLRSPNMKRDSISLKTLKVEAFIFTKIKHSYCCNSHRKQEKTAPGLKKLFRRRFTRSQVSQPNSQSIHFQCFALYVFLTHSQTQTCSLHGLRPADTYQH